MSRPNRQGFLPNSYIHPQPYNPFTVPRSYNHSPDGSETGGGDGGTHGQPPANYGAPNTATYDVLSAISYGPPLPPQTGQPQSQTRTTSSAGVSLYHGINDYNFSHTLGPQTSSHQIDPYLSGYLDGAQPQLHRPEVYHSARHGGSQWGSPDLGFQGQHLNAPVYSSDQNILGGTPGLSRRGITRDASVSQLPVHPGVSRSQPGVSYDHQYWPQENHSPSSTYSSSPSPSPDGSPNIKQDDSPSIIPLTLSPIETQGPVPSVEEYLRREINFGPNQAVRLSSLPDPPPGQRPAITLKLLVALAIFSSRHQRLTLQEIYKAIEERFPYYRDQPLAGNKTKRWQSSIRHNLSLESIFTNDSRPIAEPGKGGYWSLTNQGGFGQKRDRRRRSKAEKERIKAEEEDQWMEEDDSNDAFSNDEKQLGPSSGVRRTARSSRSPYTSSPQVMSSSLTGRTMTNSPVSYDSAAIFGQASLSAPAMGHMRYLGQHPSRTQSLPIMGGQPRPQQNRNRPATLPMPVMHAYPPNAGVEDPRRFRAGPRQSSSQDAMDVDDEEYERAQNSRDSDKGKRRAYD
ncbi:hypothetical protein D9615_005770 [Tricholomella constricta]|uniref:Fork-head domain-containing protein n=1 Tax=Tricholomella constricta TaxID=117010 RepID=A0A8H5HAK6_9AGAR|nr:hypothetical protein D9615_005770 [Tricholomella constricta]